VVAKRNISELKNLQFGQRRKIHVGAAKEVAVPKEINVIKKKPSALHQGNRKDPWWASQESARPHSKQAKMEKWKFVSKTSQGSLLRRESQGTTLTQCHRQKLSYMQPARLLKVATSCGSSRTSTAYTSGRP
jgi:hypothetical protein